MLGFIFKILMVTAIVAGVGWFVMNKKGIIPKSVSDANPGQVLSSLPLNKEAIGSLKGMKFDQVLAKLSGTLDSLVTHGGPASGPVVLGVKVSNDSISTLVGVLRSLPPEQLDQLRLAMCASPSAQ
jgi:hypothetical protein